MQTNETLCNLLQCERVAFNNDFNIENFKLNNPDMKYKDDFDMVFTLVQKAFPYLKKGELLGKKRDKEIVITRHIAMYILSDILLKPLKKTGAAMGCDHSSVIHGRDNVRVLMKACEQGKEKEKFYKDAGRKTLYIIDQINIDKI
jgi:chromosomal replication initiation ATPase DnaA